jgi:hypothetical protein
MPSSTICFVLSFIAPPNKSTSNATEKHSEVTRLNFIVLVVLILLTLLNLISCSKHYDVVLLHTS